MNLSKEELYKLCSIAIEAAERAGDIISSFPKDKILEKRKEAGDTAASQVVTEVDILSQKAILDTLYSTCKEFNIATLSEEMPDSRERFTKDYFWSIDPLDGTLPFCKQTSGYSVSIALVSKEGEPIIGVVFDPIKGRLYHAIRGEGAYINRVMASPIEALSDKNRSRGGNLDQLTVICDDSFINNILFSKFNSNLGNITKSVGLSSYYCDTTSDFGGAVMSACWTLEKRPACYIKFPKIADGGGSVWDYTATAAIFKELGGCVTDIYGEPLIFNNPDSLFMNKRGIIYSTNIEITNSIIEFYKTFK